MFILCWSSINVNGVSPFSWLGILRARYFAHCSFNCCIVTLALPKTNTKHQYCMSFNAEWICQALAGMLFLGGSRPLKIFTSHTHTHTAPQIDLDDKKICCLCWTYQLQPRIDRFLVVRNVDKIDKPQPSQSQRCRWMVGSILATSITAWTVGRKEWGNWIECSQFWFWQCGDFRICDAIYRSIETQPHTHRPPALADWCWHHDVFYIAKWQIVSAKWSHRFCIRYHRRKSKYWRRHYTAKCSRFNGDLFSLNRKRHRQWRESGFSLSCSHIFNAIR